MFQIAKLQIAHQRPACVAAANAGANAGASAVEQRRVPLRTDMDDAV